VELIIYGLIVVESILVESGVEDLTEIDERLASI
jgi:hypothetical protein